MGAHDHKEKAAREAVARVAILTVTDSKTRETDVSGRRAEELLKGAGHDVLLRAIVPNAGVATAVETALRDHDLVLTIGGTGPSRKDGSVEAARPLIAKELPGFGEMFRALSVKEIGTAAILSRAVLGTTSQGKILVCLPGSEGAVRLAVEDILLPELKHLLWELRRYG
ncbi:MAG TPA: molybdopterin-binding protein [Planctomycetota bacterium]